MAWAPHNLSGGTHNFGVPRLSGVSHNLSGVSEASGARLEGGGLGAEALGFGFFVVAVKDEGVEE